MSYLVRGAPFRFLAGLAGLAVLGAVALVMAWPYSSPAVAESVEPASSVFVLTISPGQSAATDGDAGPAEQALLTCDPPGGTHGHAVEACQELTEVNGDFTQLGPSGDTACTMEYDPVTASASGNWEGTMVNFQQTFGNRCEMYASTGHVFRF